MAFRGWTALTLILAIGCAADPPGMDPDGDGSSSEGSSGSSEDESGTLGTDTGTETESEGETGEECDPPLLGEPLIGFEWTVTFNEGGGVGGFRDLAELESGELIVVGAHDPEGSSQFGQLMARYSTTGELVWWEAPAPPDQGNYILTHVEARPGGGWVAAGDFPLGVHVAEFDAGGQLVVEHDIAPPGWDDHGIIDLELGPGGVPYVLGVSQDVIGDDPPVEQWLRRATDSQLVWSDPLFNSPASFVLDPASGDYFIAGSFGPASEAEGVGRVVGGNVMIGALWWTTDYDTAPFEVESRVRAVAFAGGGDLLASGQREAAPDQPFRPIWGRLNRESGEAQWMDPTLASCATAGAQDIVVVNGHAYTLYASGLPSGGARFSVLAIQDGGGIEWATALPMPDYTLYRTLHAGSDGALYLTATTSLDPDDSGGEWWLARFVPDGP